MPDYLPLSTAVDVAGRAALIVLEHTVPDEDLERAIEALAHALADTARTRRRSRARALDWRHAEGSR